MKLTLIVLFSILFLPVVKAQAISNEAVFSLITCDEGDEIYSLFGHSAIRVKDTRNNLDLVYNWGMFEFGSNELDFQMRFAKGRLKYYMAEESYQGFIASYQWEQRTVREQVLNLNYNQKTELWKEIQINYLPENRYYQYDFFFDNCSTRIGVLLRNVLGESVTFKELSLANQFTYRELIDKQVRKSQPWSDFGIDLALGVKIDKVTTTEEMQFLPKYLEESMSLAVINKKDGVVPLVQSSNVLVQGQKRSLQGFEGKTPSFVTWSIFIVGLIIHILNVKKLSLAFDFLFLLLISILGVVVFFLWFYTDHQPTKSNYNLLWANPIYFISLFVLFLKRKWVKTYHLVMAFYSLAIVLFWIALPQEFNEAVRPLILLQVLISYYWFRNFSVT
jgi:hypothetical protein